MITIDETERETGLITLEDLEGVRIYTADCRDAMRSMEPESIDTIITDPPYGLGFMGKEWDHGVPGVEFFAEALRIAKPGAMLFAFGGTRTFHRLSCAIEDAGWEIRDTMGWLHGQGFPKSHNVAGAIDWKLGNGDRGHRIATASRHHPDGTFEPNGETVPAYEARSPEAEPWTGYGTALKPSWGPICVAMKPLDGTYAENALKHGVAGLNIDAARVQTGEQTGWGGGGSKLYDGGLSREGGDSRPTDLGRWPANILHDGSEEATSVFPDAPTGEIRPGRPRGQTFSGQERKTDDFSRPPSSGSAARFFYCSKASTEERNEGLEGLEGQTTSDGRETPADNAYQRGKSVRKNHHPTVKPLSLMRYLVRLAKMPQRPGYRQKVLDLFAGSGTTGVACIWEDVDAVLIEKSPEHVELIRGRCAHAIKTKALQPELFTERAMFGTLAVEDKNQGELF
jgi:site-specific DNA-methyltransferase (adenine-specific)